MPLHVCHAIRIMLKYILRPSIVCCDPADFNSHILFFAHYIRYTIKLQMEVTCFIMNL